MEDSVHVHCAAL